MADWAGVGHIKVMIEWTSVIKLYATMDYTWQNDQQGAAPDPNTALRRAAVLQLLAAAAIIVHDEIVAAQRRRARRRMWSRAWLLRTPIRGQYAKLIDELRSEN